ncbi:MAG TPA: DNA mismatch repair protein MutS, partial [Nitrospiria bacterium]|nr:DNA mismatch repair protein MutS [Nitrospiria bacterium]
LNGEESRQSFPFHFCGFDDSAFDPEFSRQTLLDHFKTRTLNAFGVETLPLGVRAAGALLKYLEETQRRSLAHIQPPRPSSEEKHLVIDPVARRNLELTRRLSDHGVAGSLLWTLDRTRTAMGGRLLRNWLLRPLRERSEIQDRLDAVEAFREDTSLRMRLRDLLQKVGDLERIIGRVSLGTATGRDLIQLKVSLLQLPNLYKGLTDWRTAQSASLPALLEGAWKSWDDLTDIQTVIGQTLVDEPPPGIQDGGLIRPRIDPSLDELRTIARDGKQWISNIEAKEKEKTGIETLKIRYNQVFGYYIEISKARLGKVPPEYHRKQTLVNAERFITPELKDLEGKVIGAEEKSRKMEYELFVKLRTRVAGETRRVQSMAETLASLDTLLSLAESAAAGNFIKPEIHDGFELEITEGRHPMLERMLPGSERFVPNDTLLDGGENRLMIITGPNMAGKSTYMRQVALTVLMAQMGSFVPATRARIGLVDRIFTRVGASDDLMGGQSTFMVEMNETASILNQSTNRSLLILDEIGRGTSTFDGLSIAWAVAEYLQDPQRSGARTLFATHYHQLTELALTCPGIQNYNIAVREWNDRIIFLHKIVPGGTDRSYGIQVARLAGIPVEVIERAREILANLEKGELTDTGRPRIATRPAHSNTTREDDQISLFSNETHPIIKELRDIDISGMTPLEALNRLNELKEKAEN